MKALLFGSTGLVGQAVALEMTTHRGFSHILAPVRNNPVAPVPSVDYRISTFQEITFGPVQFDCGFCCLGTTIKKAGSREAFRAVDFDLVVRMAKAARDSGVTSFAVISSIGADKNSRVFYNQVKGEMEAALIEVNFPSLIILRPSLLSGDRNEFRLGERMAMPVMNILPDKWRTVQASTVAKAMVKSVLQASEKVNILESADIQKFRSRKSVS